MNHVSRYDPLRVLVIDKTSVLESVRDRWDRLAQMPGLEVTLLAPERWVENYKMLRFDLGEDRAYRPIAGKVWWPGKEARALYVKGLRRAFREARPDVVMMMEESFSMFALQTVLTARRHAPGARLIFYSNNITSYDRINYRLGRLYERIGRWATPQFDVGLCVNDLAADVLKRTGHDVLIQTLFYGIDERLFSPHPKREARRAFDLPENGTLLLYAGRLMELKGIQDLIGAFELLARRFPERELHLAIAGEGEYGDALKSLAEGTDVADRISWLPMVAIQQMPQLMSAADMFVLPSRKEIHEQFGRVNIEAMLCDTTIVGSTSGGIPGAIGNNGFIFNAGDVDDLVRTLTYILEHPEEERRRRRDAMTYALERFSTGAFLNGLLGVFRSLTGRPEETGAEVQDYPKPDHPKSE